MRALVQRVSRAAVAALDQTSGQWVVLGSIANGLCVLVGVTHHDTTNIADRLATKIVGLRIFDDGEGVMNRSLVDVAGEALVVSQFTLYGDASRGRRPSWIDAAPGDLAEPLVERVAEQLRATGITVATGRFGADMRVELVNDGPVTLMLEV